MSCCLVNLLENGMVLRSEPSMGKQHYDRMSIIAVGGNPKRVLLDPLHTKKTLLDSFT